MAAVQLEFPTPSIDYEAVTGHYHVGSNMIGYLPEGDVFCAENVQQAAEFFLSRVIEARDECIDECQTLTGPLPHDGPPCEWETLYGEISSIELAATPEVQGLQGWIKDQGGWSFLYTPPEGADISYWISPIAATRQDEALGKFSNPAECPIYKEQVS